MPEYWPTGQLAHDVACANGFKLGCAMNVPWRQHPKRALLEPLLLNALEVPDKDSHLLPHKVRVKPLLENTLKKE
jgi:hypothetical protein